VDAALHPPRRPERAPAVVDAVLHRRPEPLVRRREQQPLERAPAVVGGGRALAQPRPAVERHRQMVDDDAVRQPLAQVQPPLPLPPEWVAAAAVVHAQRRPVRGVVDVRVRLQEPPARVVEATVGE
jgi:hypothetical protein